MAKPATFGKRENEKKKQARRLEKQKRKEDRKQSGKPNSFEDMIAYVDENGSITMTPPEERDQETEINQEEIMISTPKQEKEEAPVLRGRIEHFNTSKGYGFIKDLAGTDKYFFHVNDTSTAISENDIVTFDLARGKRGMNAVNICLENKSAS